MKEQMPRRLRWADDPWGIGWRVSGALRRLSVGRTVRFLRAYARPRRIERPVFVVGVPRSATTLMVRALAASPALTALPREGHDLWRAFHHPRYGGWVSDRVGAGTVRRGERRFVAAWLGAYVGASRLVEKTPENALRIPYLLDLFPDARFIVMWRNPCEVIGSMIRGWRHPAGRFRSYYVPQDLAIADYPHRRRWCFALIEGWRDLGRGGGVADVALAQWSAFVDALDEARRSVPGDRFTEIWLEDLVDDPAAGLRTVAAGADIPLDAALGAAIDGHLAAPPNALLPPGPERWRIETEAEVMERFPHIATRAGRAGYRLAGDGRLVRATGEGDS